MVKDAALQNDVMAELEWEPGVNAAHIGVSAREGAVENAYQRSTAESVVR